MTVYIRNNTYADYTYTRNNKIYQSLNGVSLSSLNSKVILDNVVAIYQAKDDRKYMIVCYDSSNFQVLIIKKSCILAIHSMWSFLYTSN